MNVADLLNGLRSKYIHKLRIDPLKKVVNKIIIKLKNYILCQELNCVANCGKIIINELANHTD